MRKFGLIIAIIALAFAGCASGGGGGGGGGGASGDAYVVDLSTMTLYAVTTGPDKLGAPIGNFVKNQEPLTKSWEDVMLVFPSDLPDLTKYTRVTVVVKYYGPDGAELLAADSMGMASMIYDTNANWRADSGGNTVFKEFNIGGFSGMLHKPRGVRIGLSKNPGALLLQRNSGSPAAFIEVVAIAFHNGTFELPK